VVVSLGWRVEAGRLGYGFSAPVISRRLASCPPFYRSLGPQSKCHYRALQRHHCCRPNCLPVPLQQRVRMGRYWAISLVPGPNLLLTCGVGEDEEFVDEANASLIEA